MTKSKKSRKKSSSNSLKTFGDVTINDFANSSKPVNRPKKLASNVTSILQNIEKEKSWDEKEEYEGDFDLVRQENEDGTFTLIAKKVEKVSIAKKEDQRPGQEYPLDIWFLISRHVDPEDVGRFAAICRNAFEVTNTALFWRNLYERHYRNVPNLPERYQPESMYRMYGLKATVVRALYHVYPLFANRLKPVTTMEKHPDLLIRKQCILQWHQKTKGYWLYFFKFKDISDLPHCRRQEVKHCPDLIEMLGDVTANADESCQVLQITSSNFIAVPVVLGLALTSVNMTLSQGFQHYRLHLGFGSGIRSTVRKPQDDSTCVLDPVIDLKILNWWHPLYPQSNGIDLLLSDDG